MYDYELWGMSEEDIDSVKEARDMLFS